MQKKLLTIILLPFVLLHTLSAQNSDRDFLEVYNRISSHKVFNLDTSDADKYQKDSLEIMEMQQLLDYFNEYWGEEHELNGKAGFSFSGNENDIRNLFRIGVHASLEKGAYPHEVEFSLNLQTTIQNGVFQENISDIDMSFDFHPFVPDSEATNDGLWLENYVFVKRFSNNFLGIEQRYETGAGFILNFFSKNRMTTQGKSNLKSLENIPKYESYGTDLKRCLKECYLKKSILNITEPELNTIVDTREKYVRSNYKKYSKLRLGLLIGIYYELEDAMATNNLNFNGMDTLISQDFTATNKLRWELRPTFAWQPKDKYKLKIYPYFKMPLGKGFSTVSQGDLEDRRYDLFVDLVSSFSIQIEKNFSIVIHYRVLYDHAPKRAYLQQEDGTYSLLVGQQRNDNYGMSFRFGF
ncbi:MAG: hypothetical protein R3E32_03865 [Chitinophagales bacterium]